MMSLQGVLAFTETAKHGNFAAAARSLGLSASAVAKSVARLEQDLGLRLFHRTTRKVGLTGDGRQLFARCQRVLDEMQALKGDAEGSRREPSGTLRLNMPITFGKKVVVPLLAKLVQRHPRLELDLSFADHRVDLIGEGFDAVVRIGPLSDSRLVARPIGEQQIVLVASPAYLAIHGVPRRPADVDGHIGIAFRLPVTGRLRAWQFGNGRRQIEHHPASRFVLDEGEAVVAAATAGLGLAQVPSYMAEQELRSGRLVEVLAAHRPPALPISLVYATSRQVPPRLRVLINALAKQRGRGRSMIG